MKIAVVAEVSNTPWGERHLYVLGPSEERGSTPRAHRYRHGKAFHVSPFLEMGLEYDWRFTSPGKRLLVHVETRGRARRRCPPEPWGGDVAMSVEDPSFTEATRGPARRFRPARPSSVARLLSRRGGTGTEAGSRPGWGARLARRAIVRRLDGLEQGELTVVEGGERIQLGRRAADGLAATLTVHDPRFWSALATGGSVGESRLDGYLRVIQDLLEPDGKALVQAILMADRNYAEYRKSPELIQRLIFPGSHLPALSDLLGRMARSTDLSLLSLDDITPHYAETLARWCERFEARRERVLGLGYPEELCRLWRLYLSYCEAGFREGVIRDAQLLFARPGGAARALGTGAASGARSGSRGVAR